MSATRFFVARTQSRAMQAELMELCHGQCEQWLTQRREKHKLELGLSIRSQG